MNRYFPFILALALGGLSACGGSSPSEVSLIELNRNVLNLKIGETFQLSVSKMEGGPKDVVYLSSDSGVASVDAKGMITAHGKGEAVILAYRDAVSARCYVSVTEEAVDEKPFVRLGELKLDFSAPYFELENSSFVSPVELHTQVQESGSSLDLYVPFGSAKDQQATANVTVLQKLIAKAQGEESELGKAYEDLLAKGSAALGNEAGHLSYLEGDAFIALTTKEGETEIARYLREPEGILGTLLPLAAKIDLSTLTHDSILDFDYRAILDLVVTGEKAPSEEERSSQHESGEFLGDLFAACAGGYTYQKQTAGDVVSYNLEFTTDCCSRLSAVIGKHHDRFHLPADTTLQSLSFGLDYNTAASYWSKAKAHVSFTQGDKANTIDASLSFEADKKEDTSNHLQKLTDAKANW